VPGHSAPAAIQSRRTCLSSLDRGAPGGISSAATRARIRLADGSPGTIAGPRVPPAKAAPREDRAKSPICCVGPWHWTHRRTSTSVPECTSAAIAPTQMTLAAIADRTREQRILQLRSKRDRQLSLRQSH